MASVVGYSQNYSGTSDNQYFTSVPAGIESGDIVVLQLVWYADSTPTWPSGFTLAVSGSDDYMGIRTLVATKVADGTETGNFTINSTDYNHWVLQCAVVRGSTGLVDAQANGDHIYGPTLTMTGHSVTSTADGQLALWCASVLTNGEVVAAGLTYPSGFTTLQQVASDDHDMAGWMATNTIDTAGTYTYSGSVAAYNPDTEGPPISGVVITLVFAGGSAGKTSVQSGNWSDTSTWSDSLVPTITNNVTVAAGHTVTVTGTQFCKNLTIADTGVVKSSRTVANSLTIAGYANGTLDFGSSADPYSSGIVGSLRLGSAVAALAILVQNQLERTGGPLDTLKSLASTNLDAAVSSRAVVADLTPATAANVWAYTTRALTSNPGMTSAQETKLDGVKAKTDNLPTAPASQTTLTQIQTRIDGLTS